MIRSPLSVTMPGNTVWPIIGERGGIMTSASPELRLNSVSSTLAAFSSWRKARCMSAASAAAASASPRNEDVVARGDRARASAARRYAPSCTATSCRPG